MDGASILGGVTEVGYESYILESRGYADHLASAIAAKDLLLGDKASTSVGFDACMSSARDLRLVSAIASVWDDHLGPLLEGSRARAENGTAAAQEILRVILAADAIAASHAKNPEDALLNVGADPGIAAAQEQAATAAERADNWDPSWQTLPDDERKG